MAEAVNYALGQWEELNVFCSDGAVPFGQFQQHVPSARCRSATISGTVAYARVSTNDQQTLAIQNRAMRDMRPGAARRLRCKFAK